MANVVGELPAMPNAEEDSEVFPGETEGLENIVPTYVDAPLAIKAAAEAEENIWLNVLRSCLCCCCH